MENEDFWGKVSRGHVGDPSSWEEWYAGLVAIPTFMLYDYLGTALDQKKWRGRAVVFLLDVMDSDDCCGKGISDRPGRRYRFGYENNLPHGSKYKAAEMITLEYLRNPEDREPLWFRDVSDEPGILPRILRTLRRHRADPFFQSGQCQPRSVVKKFIKLCFEDHQWQWRDGLPGLSKARDACLVDLFRTAFAFNVGDLVTRRNEVSLEALQQVVFGPKDLFNGDDSCEPPKTMDEALVCASNVRREAAGRLVMLQAVRHAQAVAALR